MARTPDSPRSQSRLWLPLGALVFAVSCASVAGLDLDSYNDQVPHGGAGGSAGGRTGGSGGNSGTDASAGASGTPGVGGSGGANDAGVGGSGGANDAGVGGSGGANDAGVDASSGGAAGLAGSGGQSGASGTGGEAGAASDANTEVSPAGCGGPCGPPFQAKTVCVSDDGGHHCEAALRVFVYSMSSTGKLGGVAGADLTCQTAANDASLNGTFRAWLSTSTYSPSSWFSTEMSKFRLMDGTLIASNWDDLIDGTIQAPINRGIDGGSVSGPVWTGTNANGTATSDTCNEFTSDTSGNTGTIGQSDFISDGGLFGPEWTKEDHPASCEDGAMLYCFEVP